MSLEKTLTLNKFAVRDKTYKRLAYLLAQSEYRIQFSFKSPSLYIKYKIGKIIAFFFPFFTVVKVEMI